MSAWANFLKARKALIDHFYDEGKTADEVLDILSMDPDQVRLIRMGGIIPEPPSVDATDAAALEALDALHGQLAQIRSAYLSAIRCDPADERMYLSACESLETMARKNWEVARAALSRSK